MATVLKVLKIEVTKSCPLPHQPENYLIAGNVWEQVSPFKFEEIPSNFLGYPVDLWGVSDRVDANAIKQIAISQSLYLVKVENLQTEVIIDENQDTRRRVSFDYNSIHYDLACTDPNFDAIQNGQKAHNNILCISLGELFDATGCHHKIVAGIF